MRVGEEGVRVGTGVTGLGGGVRDRKGDTCSTCTCTIYMYMNTWLPHHTCTCTWCH